MAHLDTVTTQPFPPPNEPPQEPAAPPPPSPPAPLPRAWFAEPFETREVRKALRAGRSRRSASGPGSAPRRPGADRAAGRSGARQLVDAAGDAATAALTAVSAAADEAQARLAAKARMRELEHAVVTARAGGAVDVTPPSREEAMKLARRIDPASSGASFVRGMGFILAGIVAFTMIQIGGFGWLGMVVPLVILVASGSLSDQIRAADRSRKAAQIQLELARAGLGATERGSRAAIAQEAAGARPAPAVGASATAGPVAERPRLLENGDPRTRAEVLAVLDRLVANVLGWVPETDVASLRRIRDSAALALPTTDAPLDLTDHDTWLLRAICIDYVPGALDHYIALPSDLASEPLLDGRSARQVLDEQLALIERRLDEMAARSYRREAGGLLTHARFVAESLRPDPFQVTARRARDQRVGVGPGRRPGAGSRRRAIGDPREGGRPGARARLIPRLVFDHSKKDEPVKLTTITQVSVDGVMQGPGANPVEDDRGVFDRRDGPISTTRPERSWARSSSGPEHSCSGGRLTSISLRPGEHGMTPATPQSGRRCTRCPSTWCRPRSPTRSGRARRSSWMTWRTPFGS
jgi:hypothetical protein